MARTTSQSLFNALQAGRKDAARLQYANLPFGVYGLTKSGQPAKQATDRAATHEAAMSRAAELEQLNPGKRFVVQP